MRLGEGSEDEPRDRRNDKHHSPPHHSPRGWSANTHSDDHTDERNPPHRTKAEVCCCRFSVRHAAVGQSDEDGSDGDNEQDNCERDREILHEVQSSASEHAFSLAVLEDILSHVRRQVVFVVIRNGDHFLSNYLSRLNKARIAVFILLFYYSIIHKKYNLSPVVEVVFILVRD